jgi:hypothetical protein
VAVGAGDQMLLLWDSPATGQLISAGPPAGLFRFHVGAPRCAPSSCLLPWDDAWPAGAVFMAGGGLQPVIAWRRWLPAPYTVPAGHAS